MASLTHLSKSTVLKSPKLSVPGANWKQRWHLMLVVMPLLVEGRSLVDITKINSCEFASPKWFAPYVQTDNVWIVYAILHQPHTSEISPWETVHASLWSHTYNNTFQWSCLNQANSMRQPYNSGTVGYSSHQESYMVLWVYITVTPT